MNVSGKTVSTIPEAPQWNEELASDSEADIKADRAPDKDAGELQEETLKVLEMKEQVGREMEEEANLAPKVSTEELLREYEDDLSRGGPWKQSTISLLTDELIN